MSIFKCKMCGGNVEFEPGATVGECDSCGTKQTLPKTGDDVVTNLFNRANNLRLKCEFDKAEQIYEKIVQQDDSEAEAHWGIVLCKYGIEYVEDPKTLKRIPTCHRTLFDAVTADPDYLAAIDYSDTLQQTIYESEARAIDRIQKDILAIVKNEKPFDVFICYKETDESGKRTVDSTIANDIYYQLTQEGFKVFFAAITLEDKLGQEYEPYIFAALNSAKVMLTLGTKPEYFSAVWVKNEWSRFMQLMKTDRSKLLIPCYRDMDAYDLPEEFAHLQAQDMSKIGFINDVVRGIKKVLGGSAEKSAAPAAAAAAPAAGASASVDPLLKRAFMFLEDGNWDEANAYCEKVLDQDPENARAYLGKLMAELRVRKQESLKDCAQPFDGSNNYQKSLRFADPALAETVKGYIAHIKERNETKIYNTAVDSMRNADSEKTYQSAAEIFETIPDFKDAGALAKQCREKAEFCRKDVIYSNACRGMKDASNEASYRSAANIFITIRGFKDSDALAEQCLEKAEVCRKDAIYARAKSSMDNASVLSCETALKSFLSIPGWRDVDAQAEACRKKIAEIKARLEEGKRAAEARRLAAKARRKKRRKIELIVLSAAAACIAVALLVTKVIIPTINYNKAVELKNAGKYGEAINAFIDLDGFKDSDDQIRNCKYQKAVSLMNDGKYEEAINSFRALNGYKDSSDQITACETVILDIKYGDKYDSAIALKNGGKYEEAITVFKTLDGFKDSDDQIRDCKYQKAVTLMNDGKYSEAINSFRALNGYKDSNSKATECLVFIQKQNLSGIKKGDTVKFGSYEQDNNWANGTEEIEWIVLEVKGNKALVISKYALDSKPYNTEFTGVTWESCSLRTWLNGTFLSEAFGSPHPKMISDANVSDDKNLRHSSYPSNATTDKVFLLSITEVEKYFSSDSARQCKPTKYAVANGAYVNSDNGNCWWWLRSPGNFQDYAASVYTDGSVDYFGGLVTHDSGCVRPALWINLDS